MLTASNAHRFPCSPLPMLTASHAHRFPCSPLPMLTASHAHRFPCSPLPMLTASHAHRFPCSPLPMLTASNAHRFPCSPLPMLTASHAHRFPCSPLPMLTASHAHRFPCSPLSPFPCRPSAHQVRLLLRPGMFRFTFVRNPFTRALSAYLSKLAYTSSITASRRGSTQSPRQLWAKAFFRHVWQQYEEVRAPEGLVTYRAFLRLVGALMHGHRATINRHLSPQVDICNLNGIKYDYVGRFEHFKPEAERMAAEFGGKHLEVFEIDPSSHVVTNRSVVKYYNEVSALCSVFCLACGADLGLSTSAVFPPAVRFDAGNRGSISFERRSTDAKQLAIVTTMESRWGPFFESTNSFGIHRDRTIMRCRACHARLGTVMDDGPGVGRMHSGFGPSQFSERVGRYRVWRKAVMFQEGACGEEGGTVEGKGAVKG
ncbi:unnamed protein product [Closterium sp. Naga37s-1]|nr:unnamed protein product [Closterium sp. Naga37s-1]